MSPMVLLRQGGLGITENDPFTYPVHESPKCQSIKITTDRVNIFFEVQVHQVSGHEDDKLYRVVTDVHGDNYRVDLPSYCPTDRDVLPEHFRKFLEKHAEDFLVQQGIFCYQLIRLRQRPVDLDLSSVIYLLFIALWKTGSGYLSPETSLGIKPLPADVQTTPNGIPIPRYVVHCTDEAADTLGTEYTEKMSTLFEDLIGNLDPEKAHWAYILLGALTEVEEQILQDFKRRKGQGAPGTDRSKLDDQIKTSLANLVSMFEKSMKEQSISYKSILDHSEGLRAFHVSNAGVQGTFFNLPKLEDFGVDVEAFAEV